MNALILFVVWCGLLVICWPLALAAMVLLPVVWLLSLPFQLLSVVVEAVFALIKAVLLLPARALGLRRHAPGRW